MSLPSLSGALSSSSDDEECDEFTLMNRDEEGKGLGQCSMVCMDSELLAAARDVERLSEAISHRDGVIQELTWLRKREKEEFEQRKHDMYAEMRMLQGMVQSLKIKLQGEREKVRLAMSRKASANVPYDLPECDDLKGADFPSSFISKRSFMSSSKFS